MENLSNLSAVKLVEPYSDSDLIRIEQIKKSYGTVKALNDVSFGVGRGEIHTLLGENGAGKSTLIKIIMGEEQPDEGRILIDGNPVKNYSPEVCRNMGIAMVHQELAVFENLTVAENIFPDSLFRKGIVTDWNKLKQRAKESIEIFKMEIDPNQAMENLTLAQQQMVEILRCICNNQRIILLDEPTSGLNDVEAQRLITIVKELKKKGITIIYISHRINEIMSISDKITILRDGQYICTFENNENLKEQDLISKMVGRDLSDNLYTRKKFYNASSEPVLYKVQDLYKKNALQPVSFELHKKEIIGFFGLEGSGGNTLSRMLYGLEYKENGTISFEDRILKKITPEALLADRILYLNNNRKKAGLLLSSSASDNMILPVMKKMSKGMLLDRRKILSYTQKFIELFSISIPGVFQKPKFLSGGNQQKLMLSICLGTEPKLFIVNEPTRGIDVGAKGEIHKFLLKSSTEGVGIIVFSSELPELISLCDRIYVLKNKGITGCVCGDDITEESIMALAAGGAEMEDMQ